MARFPHMVKRLAAILVVGLAVSGGPAQAQPAQNQPAQRAKPVSAQALSQNLALWNLRISPDGQRYLALERTEAGNRISVYQFTSSGKKRQYSIPSPKGRLVWARWLNDQRILSALEFSYVDKNFRQDERRYFAVNADGSNLKSLGRPHFGSHRSSYGQDRLVSLLTEDPDHILLSLRNNTRRLYPKVVRANIWTGRAKTIQSSKKPITGWLADTRGRIRLGVGYKDTDVFIYTRDAESKNWRLMRRSDVFKDPSFLPLAFGADANQLFVLSNHESDRRGLYRFNISEQKFTKKIYQHPRYDVSGAIVSSDDRQVIGVSLTSDGTQTIYFDGVRKDLGDRIKRLLPGKQYNLLNADDADQKSLIKTFSSTDPGSFYMVDLKSERVTFLGAAVPGLRETDFSPMRAIEYRARDGLRISGYVTLPKGYESRNFPLIVMPHGGPAIRETDEFNPFTQFLASRGYAVLQMNFRGSPGFGRKHLQGGYRQWGLAIQDDITDGVMWAIREGIADPDRICIFGGSFGGYAALMGAVRTPELYKCAVSLNGVSDLDLMLKEKQRLTSKAIYPVLIGDRSKDKARLRATSPARNADKINIPILLAHGTADYVVTRKHTSKMSDALRKYGKTYELLWLPGGGHDVTQPQLRHQFLLALERFLTRYVPASTGS